MFFNEHNLHVGFLKPLNYNYLLDRLISPINYRRGQLIRSLQSIYMHCIYNECVYVIIGAYIARFRYMTFAFHMADFYEFLVKEYTYICKGTHNHLYQQEVAT